MYVCMFIFFLFQQSVEGQSVASPFIAATVDEQGMYVCMYVCMYVRMEVYEHTDIFMYVCMYVCRRLCGWKRVKCNLFAG